jgi:hypothetical protein
VRCRSFFDVIDPERNPWWRQAEDITALRSGRGVHQAVAVAVAGLFPMEVPLWWTIVAIIPGSTNPRHSRESLGFFCPGYDVGR